MAVLAISYILSYRHKLSTLKPPAARCYHINRLPSWTSLIPRFVLCAVTKPRGKPLSHCQLIAPHNLAAARAQDQSAESERVSFSVDWADYKEVYEYLSRIEVTIDALSIDPLHLVSFNKLAQSDRLEAVSMCYVQALRHPLTAYILAMDQFPVSPLGLCRIGVDISFFEALSVDKDYEITSSFNELRETRKGVEVDIATTFYRVDPSNPSSSKMVYQCSESFLSRSSLKMEEYREYAAKNSEQWTARRNGWRSEFDGESAANSDRKHRLYTKPIVVPDGVSMEYAKLSGDVLNPYCFWPRSNGHIPSMWALQRAVTEIKAVLRAESSLFIHRFPIKLVSSFKAPILRSTRSLKVLIKCYPESDRYLTFALVSGDKVSGYCPHILGSMVPAE